MGRRSRASRCRPSRCRIEGPILRLDKGSGAGVMLEHPRNIGGSFPDRVEWQKGGGGAPGAMSGPQASRVRIGSVAAPHTSMGRDVSAAGGAVVFLLLGSRSAASLCFPVPRGFTDLNCNGRCSADNCRWSTSSQGLDCGLGETRESW